MAQEEGQRNDALRAMKEATLKRRNSNAKIHHSAANFDEDSKISDDETLLKKQKVAEQIMQRKIDELSDEEVSRVVEMIKKRKEMLKIESHALQNTNSSFEKKIVGFCNFLKLGRSPQEVIKDLKAPIREKIDLEEKKLKERMKLGEEKLRTEKKGLSEVKMTD